MADVLVVEATPLVRAIIADTLRDAGLGVLEAASAGAALAAVDEVARPPQVLVTAIVLSRGSMNGTELAAALRCRWPDLGVIYLAEHWMGLADEALGTRERCLTKPFEPARFARSVCELAPTCPNPPRLIRGRAVTR
jgi:CheY-like chemotaxis protein